MTSKPPAAIPMKHQSSSRSDNATAEVETCTRRHKVGGKQMHCGHTFTDECWECFHSFAALWTEKSNVTSEIFFHSFVISARIQESRRRNERKGRGADLHPACVHFPRPEQPSSHRPTNTSSNAHVIKPLPLSCRHRKRVYDVIARRGRGRVMCCQL